MAETGREWCLFLLVYITSKFYVYISPQLYYNPVEPFTGYFTTKVKLSRIT